MPSLEVSVARGKSPLDDDELYRLAAAAWHKEGIIVLRPERIVNEFDRQAVINAADTLYGKRKES